MENSKFDKYIKSHTQKELEVPAGLSWEEMNIPLPEQKKKRRGFFWLWMMLLGVIIGGGTVMLLQSDKEVSKSIVEENVVSRETVIQTNTILENSSSEMVQTNGQTSKESKPKQKQDISVINTYSSNVKTIKRPIVSNPIVNSDVITTLSSDFQSINSINKISKKSKPVVQPSSNETLRTVVSIQNIDGVKIELTTKDRVLPQLDLIEIENDENKENTKPSLFINFGINQSWSNYSQGNQLDALTLAEDLAFGNSIQVGLKFPLKNKFFLT